MARTKAPPVRRETSDTWLERNGRPLKDVINLSNDVAVYPTNGHANGSTHNDRRKEKVPVKGDLEQPAGGLRELVICAAGIYASFLTWAIVQERITTTPYGTPSEPEIFDFSIFLNTVQSAFASLAGYLYLLYSSRNASSTPKLFPTSSIIPPMVLVSITSSLASPFGYASLKYVGYITFILAKSCKLLPVMTLHVSVFRRRYPLYKYAVVALVTAGVAVFTLYHPSSAKKASKSQGASDNSSLAWGLLLLSINLLFDGLTNSTQDYINSAFKPYSGSQMMCAQNLISTALTTAYLLSSHFLATSPLASSFGISSSRHGNGELQESLAFLSRNPAVIKDILLFSSCGAIGQVFIFFTLSKFSSLLLVTITVTRKMLTMLLSVVWFRHRLTLGQWIGVLLVFGGVGAEAAIGRWEKQKKEREKKELERKTA